MEAFAGRMQGAALQNSFSVSWFSMKDRQSRKINILFENLLTGRMKRGNGRGRGEKEEYI